jgi:hypothetical protein
VVASVNPVQKEEEEEEDVPSVRPTRTSLLLSPLGHFAISCIFFSSRTYCSAAAAAAAAAVAAAAYVADAKDGNKDSVYPIDMHMRAHAHSIILLRRRRRRRGQRSRAEGETLSAHVTRCRRIIGNICCA